MSDKRAEQLVDALENIQAKLISAFDKEAKAVDLIKESDEAMAASIVVDFLLDIGFKKLADALAEAHAKARIRTIQ